MFHGNSHSKKEIVLGRVLKVNVWLTQTWGLSLPSCGVKRKSSEASKSICGGGYGKIVSARYSWLTILSFPHELPMSFW